jgi:hypothetical protein
MEKAGMYLVMLEIEVWLVDGVDKIVGLERSVPR